MKALSRRWRSRGTTCSSGSGVLRFGKLTMDDTDLLIQDADRQDWFDFWLDRYNDQLVAGSSRNTRDHGLIVQMPDWRAVGQAGGRAGGRWR